MASPNPRAARCPACGEIVDGAEAIDDGAVPWHRACQMQLCGAWRRKRERAGAVIAVLRDAGLHEWANELTEIASWGEMRG